MHAVKPALALSLLVLLVSGCWERTRSAPAAAVVVDECRYTLRRPERQELRVWDGRFLEEERIPCFGRSRCFVGGEGTRVYAAARDRLVIEVGARRLERSIRKGRLKKVSPHNRLHQAIVGDHAVALVEGDSIEVVWEDGEVRFPRPILKAGEAIGGPARAGDGIGLYLVEDEHAGLPVRPFLWLKAPSAREGEASAPESALIRDGVVVGTLERVGSRWRASLSSGWVVDAPFESPVLQGLWLTDDLLISLHEQAVIALARDGRRYERTIEREDSLIEVDERVYLLGPGLGVERVSAAGAEVIIERKVGADLAGEPLGPGAVVERVRAAGDESTRIAVIERVRRSGCRAEDRLHIVDLEKRTVTTLARDDRIRLHPRFARGKLHFTEADAVYEVVGL